MDLYLKYLEKYQRIRRGFVRDALLVKHKDREVKRVPSKENIADGPSRDDWELIQALNIARVSAGGALKEAAALLSENTALLFGAAKATLNKPVS